MKRRAKNTLIPAEFEALPVFTALFTAGIALSYIFTGLSSLMLSCCLLCLVLSFVSFFERQQIILLCIASLAAGGVYGASLIIRHDFSDFRILDGTRGRMTGIFSGEYQPLRSGGVLLKLGSVIYEFDDQKVSIPGLVQCHTRAVDSIPEPEQTYSIEGRFVSPEPGRLPAFRGENLEHIESNALFHHMAGRLQRKIRDGLNTVLPRQHASIVTGFILGDTSKISPDDRRLFRETGISHLLAISGQHIMVLIMVLAAILYWLNIPPISRSIIMIAVLAGYALTTSGSPSVWRALTMYICLAAIMHLEAFPSPTMPVAVAALLILLHNPAVLFNASFQLSFTAIISIIMLRKPLESLLTRLKLPDTLKKYLAITFAANLGTMPMTAFLFGTVSASAMLVNPLLLWSFSYMLPVAFLVAFLSFIWPAAAIFIAPGLTLFLDGFMQCLTWFNSIPGSFFYVGNLSGITVAVAYSLMLFIAARHNQIQIQSLAPAQIQKTDAVKVFATTESPVAKAALAQPSTSRKTVSDSEVFYRYTNIFRDKEIISHIESSLQNLGRRALKNTTAETGSFPVNLLSLENQNLYYQLTDLDRKVLKADPARIIQAQIFLMALTGNEILSRIAFHLKPPPRPDEIKIEAIIRERHLAAAVLADSLLNSSLLTRAADESLMMMVSRAQTMFTRARNQLERIVSGKHSDDAVDQHISLRRDMLLWCHEFIDYDLRCRKTIQSGLRNEQ